MIGRLVDVVRETPGTAVVGDVPTGASVLDVHDTAAFTASGGRLLVDGTDDTEGVSLDYTGITDSTIVLTVPLAGPVTEGTGVRPLDVLDQTPVRWVVWVFLDDDPRPAPADLPTGLIAYFVEGDAQAGMLVEVELVGGRHRVVSQPDTIPRQDGAFIDPDTLPASGPTAPPVSSPGVRVTGLPDGLVLQLDGPVEAGARVQYHLSADETAGVGFVPSEATQVGAQTFAGASVVDALPDGMPFTEGVSYYARAVAVNDLGQAPPGVGGMGQLDRDAVREVVTAALVAGFILTGRIQIGQAYIDADEGFVIPNPDGTVSRIPFDGSPIDFVAMVTALTFTATGLATFLGLMQIRRRAEVGDGVGDPTTPAQVAPHWPTRTTQLASQVGSRRGLVEQIGSPTRWVVALRTDYRSDAFHSGFEARFAVIDKTSGAVSPAASDVVPGNENRMFPDGGITRIGSRYYVLGVDSGVWRVHVFEADFTKVMSWGFGSVPSRPAIGTDGTRVLIAWSGGQDQVRVDAFNTAGWESSKVQYTLTPPGSYASDTAWVGVGDFGYGSPRVVVQPADRPALVWSGTLGNPTRQTTEDLALPGDAQIRGMVYAADTTEAQRFHTLTDAYMVARYSTTRRAQQTVSVAYSWYGQTAGGANIETRTGGAVTADVPAGAGVLVTVPTPPEADDPAPGKANRARVYAAASGATRRLQATLTQGVRAAALDALPTTGQFGPGTNGFAAIAVPGDIVPERGTSDATKMWRLIGTGGGRVGGHAWTPEGLDTVTGAYADVIATGTRNAIALHSIQRAAQFRGPATAQSIGNNAYTALGVGTLNASPDGTITRTGNVITLTEPGLYAISGFARFAANATGVRILIVETFTNQTAGNGTPLARDSDAGTNGIDLSVATEVTLPGGTQLRLCGYQNSGGNLNVLGDPTTQLNVRRVG